MPSVYEIRHLELDNVGRGKRSVRTPIDREESDIFGTRSPSVAGSIPSSPSTPGSSNPSSRRGSLRGDDTQNRLFGLEVNASPRRVRDSITKSSIFSDQIDASPKPSPKKTPIRRNPITGEIIAAPVINGVAASGIVNGHGHVNSISGNGTNGHSNGHSNGHANGHTNGHSNGNGNGHSNGLLMQAAVSPLPATPSRVRQPPGGRCNGIF